jgi:hypothetical protein
MPLGSPSSDRTPPPRLTLKMKASEMGGSRGRLNKGRPHRNSQTGSCAVMGSRRIPSSCPWACRSMRSVVSQPTQASVIDTPYFNSDGSFASGWSVP